ncbi:MFS transporter, partial [bacterium]|nr:MFS transporter [bacterium]
LRYSPAIIPHHQHIRTGTLDHYTRRNRYLFLGLLTGMSVLRATVIVTLNNFSPLYLTKLGFGPEIAALSVSVLLLAAGIGSFLGGIISDWMGRKMMLVLSLVLAIPFSVLYVWTPGWPKFIFLALAGFSLSASLPVTVLIAQGIAPKRTGLASSLMMGFCWGIAGLLLTPLGALAEHIGLEAMLFFVALLPLIALLFVFPIPKIANS